MMVRVTASVLALSLLLAGCVSQPANYASTLSVQDPKWDSQECRDIRLAAVNYDDKVGQRVAIGLATGLLLGPFGLPIAAAADMNQNEKRKMFAREVHMRCSSLPLPDKLKMTPQQKTTDTTQSRSR